MGTLVKGNSGISEEDNPAPAAVSEEQSFPPSEAAAATAAPPAKPEVEAKADAKTPENHEPPPIPVRLCSVAGYDGRVNDIVYCPPTSRTDQNKAVIYFGGDVQVKSVKLNEFFEN